MKKTMEKLNKHFFPLLVVALLLVGSCLPIRVSAAANLYLDYTDLDYSVKYGTDYNTVNFNIPEEHFMFWYVDMITKEDTKVTGSDTLVINTEAQRPYNVSIYPANQRGFLLNNIPVDARICVEIAVFKENYSPPLSGTAAADKQRVFMSEHYTDSNGTYLQRTETEIFRSSTSLGVDTYRLDYTIADVTGAVSFVPALRLEYLISDYEGILKIQIVSSYVEMDVDKQFWSQFQTQQNGKMLGEIKDTIEESTDKIMNGTDEQHAIINDSVQGMEQASNKLDGLGDQLNSVEKPNVDNMDVSADKLFGGMVATTMLTAPVLEIWKNPVALSILTVVVTIVLISWVFFGKK